MHQGILLTVDYHDQNCSIRRLNLASAAEHVLTVPTTAGDLLGVVADARRLAGRRGRVIWVQESTTGWARVQELLGERVEFLLANVVQMPLPPKGRRRKTDKIDTARLQREYRNGELPLAYQPPPAWRQLRRLVACRENLVSRRTALRNWVNRYLAHETWTERAGLWSAKGRRRLATIVAGLPARDRLVVSLKLAELDELGPRLQAVEAELFGAYQECPEAQRLDAVRGIGVIAAIAIVARIGPVERFGTAEQLIAYAGLAPGVRQSDRTRRDGRIGGGGTDKHLRHYLIEATVWARQLPRYQASYARVAQRRGSKIGRLVVARLLVRSIYKVLKDGVAFAATPAAAGG
ncbi:MAG TPA: IS110 family transposase [Gemmataceae bacterium]|jgi:transposase|nr:IS110 family transposase [Gemmataceae bacterium]